MCIIANMPTVISFVLELSSFVISDYTERNNYSE